jgi:hypothetical protein
MAMVHLVDPHHFIHALSTVSGYLAETSARNSKSKGFYETMLTALNGYANIFSEMAFDTLPQYWKWDHAIKLECQPSSGFRKVYQVTLTKSQEMDTFLEEVLATSHKETSVHFLTSPISILLSHCQYVFPMVPVHIWLHQPPSNPQHSSSIY